MPSESVKRHKTGTKDTFTILPHLHRMAKGKKVSNAWIIRDAVEKYIEADTPLFAVKEAR